MNYGETAFHQSIKATDMTSANELNPQLLIVTPVYEDRDALRALLGDLSKHISGAFTVIAIDDGSLREPIDSADLLKAYGIKGYVLKLFRNVGHQRAIAVGLSFVVQNFHGPRAIVVMDSDGEDSPSSVAFLLTELGDPNIDVVVARRASRIESLHFKFFYQLYKIFFKLMTGRTISFGNFMVLTSSAADRLAGMAETQIHLAASVLSSKLRVREVITHRFPRYAGHSKMNFVELVLHGFRGMMVFAENVLVRVGIICGVIALLSILLMLMAVALKAAGIATPGWFSVALGLLILIIIQMGALALTMLLMTGNLKTNQTNPIEQNLKLIKDIKHGG